MDLYRELSGLFTVWLALVIVTGYWAARIAMLLYRQHRAERAWRMRLAAATGRAVREAGGRPEVPGA